MLPLVCRRRFKQLHSQSKPLLAAYFSTTAGHGDSRPTRPTPPPIQVQLTQSAGRGVFATRRIESGELIHTAEPIVSHPSLSSIDRVCYFCLRNLAKGSQKISFCSDECRQQAKGFYEVEKEADWSSFDNYCRAQGLKYPLIVKRLACMVISGVVSADCLNILQPALLTSEMISQMEVELGFLKNALEDAGIAGDQMNFLTSQWYTEVLARIRINAFRVELVGGYYEDLLTSAAASVESEVAAGNAVYMLPSFYNHDCDPNAHIIWIENVVARVKALRDIEEGEEMRICYIDTSMDYDARQNLLSKGFGFHCCCPRCMSKD